MCWKEFEVSGPRPANLVNYQNYWQGIYTKNYKIGLTGFQSYKGWHTESDEEMTPPILSFVAHIRPLKFWFDLKILARTN